MSTEYSGGLNLKISNYFIVFSLDIPIFGIGLKLAEGCSSRFTII